MLKKTSFGASFKVSFSNANTGCNFQSDIHLFSTVIQRLTKILKASGANIYEHMIRQLSLS